MSDGRVGTIPYAVTTTHEGHAVTQKGSPAMTRRLLVALVTLFSTLIVASIASTVSADDPCDVNAQPQCAQVANDAALAPASSVEQRAIYRVSGSDYYVPRPGGMWAVIHYPTDGLPVIEDYVSGPPPANSVPFMP
jgi:hypothetical protein